MTDSQVASLVVPQEARAYSATGSEAAAEFPRMDGARTLRHNRERSQGTDLYVLPG
jgi:hypothetical protein